MNTLTIVSLSILSLLLPSTASAKWSETRTAPTQIKDLKYGPIPSNPQTDASMQTFRKYGLGQMIHWGVYAISGNEWEGVSARQASPDSAWVRT